MIQPSGILWMTVLTGALLFLPGRAVAQSGTVTDDAFLSSSSATQQFNVNGQGIVLIVAGSSATVGPASVGTAKTYIKFQLQSSLPGNVAAANVAKATLKLFQSPGTNPTGAIDIYPIATAWTESTLNPSTSPGLAWTPFATGIPVGKANSFLVVDVTQLVQEWLKGSANGGLDNDGIALVANTSTTHVVFDSKENVVTSHEPRLEIVLVDSGPQGPAGPQGSQGPQGPSGANGLNGTAATLQVGTTMTVPAGTPASVLNGGTSNAAVLNFLIPQGPAGLAGAQGPQGPVGINNQGAWNSTTAYNKNDAAFDSASYWLATSANTNSEPSPTNTNWQWLAGGIVNRGVWSASNTYSVNDAVTDGGSYWLALVSTSASSATPSTSCQPSQAACSADWQLLAQQGAPGLKGDTGAQGPQGIQGIIGLQGPPGPMPNGAALTTTANNFNGNQTINGNLILAGTGAIQFADGTVQSSASTTLGGTSCPAPSEVSSSSPIAPLGYIPLGTTNGGNLWVTMAPMPTARSYLATVTVNGKVYAIGGIDNNGNYLNRVEVYNPATNNWSQAAPMPTARGNLAAAVDAQGNIYAIGGLVITGGQPQILSTVEVYNPTTNSWGQAKPMSFPRYGLAAATDAQGNIYAIGGISLNGMNESVANTVEVYNPTISGWSIVANMPTGRFGLTAATDTQGNIYAIGGCCGGTNSTPAILSNVEVYSPATNSWSTAAPMPSARAFLAAALGAQGNISAIGGYNAVNINNLSLNFSSPLNTVEVYNPTTSSWTTAANMPTARAGLVAGADAQGNIYAIGGLNSASMGSSATERYSPPITIYVFIHQ